MTVNEKIISLRRLMSERGMSAYLIPTDDFHASEYVGDYFKCRKFMSGFTGSAGTLIVTEKEAHLWADGRYFVQAAKQIAGSEIILERMLNPGVPTVDEFLLEHLKNEGACLGFDGRCVTYAKAKKYLDFAKEHGSTLKIDEDLVDIIWGAERPAMADSDAWILEEKYAGESVGSRLDRVRDEYRKKDCTAHLLTELYDIAYLLNLRADDIENVPVFLAYLIIKDDGAVLFTHGSHWSDEVKVHLKKNGVELKEYNEVYDYLSSNALENQKILLDKNIVNIKLVMALPETASLEFATNPSNLMRAVKNATEIANTKRAHIEDGVAMVRFAMWLYDAVKAGKETEITASDYLAELRAKGEGFLDLSFDTIAAYGPNAAMMHYFPVAGTEAELKPEGMLLVDCGGHYLTGTTDITRTYMLGELTQEMKESYTTVLRCHLRLLDAHFMKGMNGPQLDILARGPVWDQGLDYRCGTGHGVGHILNVHEGPNSFRWNMTNLSAIPQPLELGMITTDEPGLYVENGYGIRIESELLCVEDQVTEYGTYYKFEPITYAPIDLGPVIKERLTQYEIKTLNDYHRLVYDTLSPKLSENEKIWLKEATKPI